MKRNPPEGRSAETVKRAYSRPELVVYGDLTQLTRNVDNKAANLDGGGQKAKTG